MRRFGKALARDDGRARGGAARHALRQSVESARACASCAAAGADCIVGLPLYPQSTRACTGTCREEFERRMDDAAPQARRGFVAQYWNAPGYIEALAASVRRSWAHGRESKLVVSFHSVPVSFAAQGDTYVEATKATTRLLTEALGMAPADTLTTYQSRFDSREWQGPMLVPELERRLPARACATWRWCARGSQSIALRRRSRWASRRPRRIMRPPVRRA